MFTARFAALRLVAGAAMISFSGVFVKLVTVSPTTSAFWRVFLGGLMLAAWVAWKKRSLLPGRALLSVLFVAAVFFALDLAFWHRSIVLIGPGLSTLLGNFQVFILTLVGVLLFRERLGLRTLIAIPLALLGLAFIVGLDWSALPRDARLGVIFGLLTAVMYAAYLLCMRYAQSRDAGRDASADLAVASLFSAVLLGAYVLTVEGSLAPASASDTVWLVVYALVSQVFGWVLITSALVDVPAARVGLILLAQPALAFVWDIAFFARVFTPLEASGAVIALAAIYLGNRPVRSGTDA